MRLDQWIAQNNEDISRSKALELIKNGSVLVNQKKVTKPSHQIEEKDQVEVTDILKWVGRAALKLEKAIDHWNIDCKGKIAADIGASTGGFCEVLVSEGVNRVYAIDVGHDQMHEKIKEMPQVMNHEGINARNLTVKEIPEKVDVMVSDLSFISLTLVIPKMVEFTKKDSQLILLIKPQFEVGKENIEKSKIVTSKKLHHEAIAKVTKSLEENGCKVIEVIDSPIKGSKGNKEYLVYAVKQ